MELKDIWNALLALLGIGGLTYMATGAWSVPQSGIYSSLLPASQWLYAGDTASCIWEVHPNTTKTINSVSYGTPGNWTSCTQNSLDWLLWTCGNVTVAEGNVQCPGIRIVQNEYPGTSETLDAENYTFKTASVKGSRFPGCTSADCTITSGASIAAGTYIQRNLKLDAAMTFAGNVSIIATENLTIGSTGSITISTAANPYKLNVTAYRFLNSGTISGNGYVGGDSSCSCSGSGCSAAGTGGNAANAYFYVGKFNNSGTISLVGGTGGAAGAICCGVGLGSASAAGGNGGNGGNLIISTTVPTSAVVGTINMNGGLGRDGAACCGTYAAASAGGNGGNSGSLVLTAFDGTSSSTVSFNGGNGGAGASSGCSAAPCGNGGNAGSSKNQNITIHRNITVTAQMSAVAGTAGAAGNGAPWATCSAGSAGTNGAWNVSHCANGTEMNWTKFSPTAVMSAALCLAQPAAPIVVPNTTSNYVSYLQNISVDITKSANITLVVSFSKDNGSTWEWLSPDFYSIPFNGSNNGTPYLNTHRQGSDYSNYSWVRVIAFNNSSGIYSEPNTFSFNLTDMATAITSTAVPNGSVSTNTIRFTCEYTNTTDNIEAATPYIYLDGTAYPMSENTSAQTYYWDNNQTLAAGPHWWQCLIDKANYRTATSTNTSFNVTGFGIFYPTGQTSVKLSCPFPTISGITPAGQKAGIGIFRIVNYNSTALHNYSLFLNNTLPSGVTIYGRCDRFSPKLANWTVLSTDTGYKGLINVNSTNTSAYCWLRMDCVSATPGTYTPFDYIFTEE